MRLHGFPVSNYYNMVKLTLLEKELAFEEVVAHPSQDEAYLAKSPMGKIPFLETNGVFIAESLANIQYLDKLQPEPALFPSDPVAAGRAMQIHQMITLYVDGEARKMLGAALFGKEATQEAIDEAYTRTVNAILALNRIANFSPFIVGDQLTHADMAAVTTLPVPTTVFTRLGKEDPMLHLEGYADYLKHMAQRPSVQKVFADQKAAMAAFLAKK